LPVTARMKKARTRAGRGRGRRAPAGLLAVLAVLLNLLSPPGHSVGNAGAAPEHAAGHAHHAAGPLSRGAGDAAMRGPDGEAADHAICHFCRQTVAALPPPCLVLLALAGDPAPAWPEGEAPCPPLPDLHAGNRPRAPPGWA